MDLAVEVPPIGGVRLTQIGNDGLLIKVLSPAGVAGAERIRALKLISKAKAQLNSA
jgi:hypothetical protein